MDEGSASKLVPPPYDPRGRLARGKSSSCIGLTLLIALTAGCNHCYDENPCGFNEAEYEAYRDDCSAPVVSLTPVVTPYSGDVERIEVRPGVLQAALGSTFILEAHLIDTDDRLVREGDPAIDEPAVEWEFPDGITHSNKSPGGHTVVIAIGDDASAFSTDIPGDFTVSVVLKDPAYGTSSYSAGSAVLRIVSPQVAAGDVITDPDAAPAPPIVAIVDGRASDGTTEDCNNDVLVAFVGAAELAQNFVGDCLDSKAYVNGAADRLSTNRAYRRFNHAWKPEPETLDLTANTTMDAMAVGTARVWDGVDSVATNTGWELLDESVLIDAAALDADVTTAIFAANRAGIEIAISSSGAIEVGDVVRLTEYPQLDSVCSAISAAAGSLPDPPPPWNMDPGSWTPIGAFLDIVYVAKMPGRGYSCPDSPMILLDWHQYQATTAAHEFGHLTELRNRDVGDDIGHTNGLPGFDQYNLMWEGSDVIYASERFYLTVGQVYRMNRHEDTWIQGVQPTRPLVDCGTDGTGTAGGGNELCPPLSKDID